MTPKTEENLNRFGNCTKKSRTKKEGLIRRNIPPGNYKQNISTDHTRVGTFELKTQHKWDKLNSLYHELFGYRELDSTSYELEIDFAKVDDLKANERINFKKICRETFRREDCDRIQVEINRFNKRKHNKKNNNNKNKVKHFSKCNQDIYLLQKYYASNECREFAKTQTEMIYNDLNSSEIQRSFISYHYPSYMESIDDLQ